MGSEKWLKLAVVLCGMLYCVQGAGQKGDACGGRFPGGSGTITLPTEECVVPVSNWTYPCYKQSFTCQWTIEGAKNDIIMLNSDDFFLEYSDNCQFDYLEMIEGNDKKGMKCCGWKRLRTIFKSNKLTIIFKSDESYEGSGFTFHYTTYQPDTANHCNTSIVGGQDGKIFNNPNSDSSCFYSIEAPEGKVVELRLKMLQFGSNACEEERLVIHNGPTTQAEVIKTWCSDNAVRPEVLSTTSQALFIEYLNVIGSETERFMIEYQFKDYQPVEEKPLNCSRMYKDITDEVHDFPSFEANKSCVVVVRNSVLEKGKVQVTFDDLFHLEKTDKCEYDNLTVQSGEREDSQMLGGPYCGTSLGGRTFVTYGNSLRLVFSTDLSMSWFGAGRAKISIVPAGSCDEDLCKRGVCVLQGYEKLCKDGKKCRTNTCDNGGTCVEYKKSRQCYCPPGFSGDDCSDGSQAGGVRFTNAPKSMKIKKGEDIFPTCLAPGAYEYVWYFNGKLLGEYNAKTNGFGTHKGGVLQIDDIDDFHEGEYTCVAKTPKGNAEHIFEITIQEDCDVEFTSRPQSITKRVEDSILFICRAPNAKKITWKRAVSKGMTFTPVDVGPTSRFKQQRVTNYLMIENAVVEDTGIYRCIAEDARGCQSQREANLNILATKRYNKYCGISRHDEHFIGRIVGGEDARPEENPWFVAFQTNFKRSGKKLTFCGGSLISRKHVLTAAHCVEEFHTKSFNDDKEPFSKTSVQLLFGTTNCRTSNVMRFPERVIVHPHFNLSAPYDSDIAIIELDSPVDYGNAIRPICLDTEENIEAMFFSQRIQDGSVTGCGKVIAGKYGQVAKTLQTVRLPYKSVDMCEELVETWNENRSKKKVPPIKFTENMICAGFMDRYKSDSCGGDSGGPYTMNSNNQQYQVGIVSFGPECGKSDMVGFYTNAPKFFDWIKAQTDFDKEQCEDCKWSL